MTRAYRVPVLGGRPDANEGWRSRVARGRPNWWVILAVSLGLMALLVATAGGTPVATRRGGGSAQAAARTALAPGAHRRVGNQRRASRPTATPHDNHHTDRRRRRLRRGRPVAAPHSLSSGPPRAGSTPRTAATSVTTTTQAPADDHDDDATACGAERRAGRPHTGLSRPPVGHVEQVRVHRDGRHGDLGGVVGRHVSHHGGQLPRTGARTWAGPRPWQQRFLTPPGAVWPRFPSLRRRRHR